MKNPKPLNKAQRDRAERARKLHTETVRLTAQADQSRQKRDAVLSSLLDAGVPPFVVVNETGVPATTLGGVIRKMRGNR